MDQDNIMIIMDKINNIEMLIINLSKEIDNIKCRVSILENNTQSTSIREVKKNATSYWGVELEPNIIQQSESVRLCFEQHPEIIPLKKIHSTLLYVGKKQNDNEEVFRHIEGILCDIIIDGYGFSDNAIAYKVNSINYVNNSEVKQVPSFATIQHITLGLKKGVHAVESVKVLSSEGTYNEFQEKILVKGILKRFLF
jgi:hypothetical protein